ncbi:MAG TPA: hypothetical protein VH187_17695 [Scandinavium sp.]|nr:hypothetical protein [Scandinavium sp.]HEX4502974.1 hypothetical protein [Scandinavium sp.]
MHGFACKILIFYRPAAPALARPQPVYATALKPTSKAGRRGGESIARKYKSVILFIIRLTL